jgi:hypothetical protein
MGIFTGSKLDMQRLSMEKRPGVGVHSRRERYYYSCRNA